MCAFLLILSFHIFHISYFELIIPSKLFHFNKKKKRRKYYENPNLLLCGLCIHKHCIILKNNKMQINHLSLLFVCHIVFWAFRNFLTLFKFFMWCFMISVSLYFICFNDSTISYNFNDDYIICNNATKKLTTSLISFFFC